jgi:hypothetical protein
MRVRVSRCGFFGQLLTIKAAGEDTDGRMAVIDHRSRRGAGSP